MFPNKTWPNDFFLIFIHSERPTNTHDTTYLVLFQLRPFKKPFYTYSY